MGLVILSWDNTSYVFSNVLFIMVYFRFVKQAVFRVVFQAALTFSGCRLAILETIA